MQLATHGLDKFQIEIDLHSKRENMYFGLFLGISGNTHVPTARKCMLTKQLITEKEELNKIFDRLKIDKEETDDMLKIKYWDMKNKELEDYVIKI